MPILDRMASVSQHQTPRTPSWRHSILPLLAICASILPTTAAEPRNVFAATTLVIPQLTPSGDVPAATLLIDDRIPVKRNGQWLFVEQDETAELRKRAHTDTETDTDIDTTATTAPATTKTRSTVTITGTGTTTTGKTTTKSKTTSSSPLPSVFDGNLASNFSTGSACPTFISNFLADPTFKKCYPFSMLLQGSRSMFNAEKSLVSITQVLDATCAANATFCTGYFKELATNLTSASNCGADYKLGNSVVVQAYLGMTAYQPLYTASCLKDAETSSYCFGNAITNLTTPANAYFYFLPLNISLPVSSVPSCNRCLQLTMGIYRSAAADRTASIANTYISAAQQVDTVCGPAFVNDSLPEAISGGFSLKQGALSWMVLSILLSIAAQQLLF
ncbi:c6 zinc finger domain containing protein [Ophiostoma piceae UAMH 11346]|uniref:C6 zinc finger domain containing protein n=1 Tax=Ophiostoma piceae (strain UAMH 11346) TaxID=1262450 RepID=S3CUD6_OPHP1|nr:c6 zinc finger domain containing protein [Ophiostoma piceae UAMH 11346]